MLSGGVGACAVVCLDRAKAGYVATVQAFARILLPLTSVFIAAWSEWNLLLLFFMAETENLCEASGPSSLPGEGPSGATVTMLKTGCTVGVGGERG